MNILVFGDSIACGAWDTEGGWVARLKKVNDKKVLDSNFQTYNTISNVSISGDTSRSLNLRFNNELIARINPAENNKVIIAIGVNDSQISVNGQTNEVPLKEFEKNIQNIVQIAQRHKCEILIMNILPVDESKVDPIPWRPEYSYIASEITKYNDILSKLTKANNLVLIDLHSNFLQQDYKKLFEDGIHPNNKGHRIIFEIINSL
jgi:lysophospholipase L1-like esterase